MKKCNVDDKVLISILWKVLFGNWKLKKEMHRKLDKDLSMQGPLW